VILHPGILALLSGSIISTFMVLYASSTAVHIISRWDINSSTSEQISLERKTYLISTIMNLVLGFYVFSLFLFVYTAEDLHHLFTGAMCATGTLNANPAGWKVLYLKICLFFITSIWMGINRVDQQAEDYPLVRTKYIMLLFIIPFVLFDLHLQFKYFLGLKPNVIVSCCGALFDEGAGVASTMAHLPEGFMMVVFYVTAGIFLFLSSLSLLKDIPALRYMNGILSVVLLFVSLLSIISFISVYYYELPSHHCPFDLLQREYHYVGYPLYLTLFGGVYYGLMPAVLEILKRDSLKEAIKKAQKRYTGFSMVLISIFTIISSLPILFSGLRIS